MKVSIVSLAWNKMEMTREFLRLLQEYTDIPFDLIFTDNGSTEPIPQMVKDFFPEAQVIAKETNVGCPATRNEAMQFVKSDITFWLDNDCYVGPKWYEPVLDKLKDPTIGISGPDGWVAKNPFNPTFPFEHIESGDCDYFVGYLMGFKTNLYKPINDYHLPVNLDDVECCLGVKANGGRAVISEPCNARHLVSQTNRGWGADSKVVDMWNNWPDKQIFERYKK